MGKIKIFTHAILRIISILQYTIIYAFYNALMSIKLFNYTIQLTFFLHKPTYSCYKPRFQNYEPLIATNPMNYQSFLI